MAVRKHIIKKYKALPVLERYEILDIIKRVATKRDKALISFLYLTGCRIEEVVKYKVKKEGKYQVIGYPIRHKQVEHRGDVIIIHNVRCLKSRVKNKVRSIPILINKSELPFIKIFVEYYNTLKDQDDFLFNLSRQRVNQILEELNIFPHYLRHLRLTHLATNYDFTEAQLKTFTGWDTTKSAVTYTHLNVGDLINKMRKM